jgi:NAD(P)-dependent dehydrogenase (short-subunit alcohol dehydrogenase family)
MSDPWRLDGTVALVTGGGRGIGRSCAAELARAGATVMVVARSASDVEAVAQAIDGVAHVADVTDETQVAQVVAAAEALGDLRVLVTAAGTNLPGPAAGYPMADWDLLFNVNVRATFLACREMGESLLHRDVAGSIVTISSQMGTVGYPCRVAYCASKHAVDGVTRALAVEWARAGIRVNAVAPTFVETPLTARMLSDPEFRSEIVERRLPTGKLAELDDVARAARYLACAASNSVTGHILRVDGGWTAW